MLKTTLSLLTAVLVLVIAVPRPCAASAYDAHPKLVVILVLDQFRGDYLERYRTDFQGKDGFNLFLDHGAYFPECYYDYANLETASGHATLGTGAYTDGHGIPDDQWWDLSRNSKRPISSVEDPRYSIVGLPPDAPKAALEGASPRNLLATTIGDQVRLATQGQSKLYGISLKDRAAILLSGHTANGAFWIDPQSGTFVTSTYYMPALPAWATAFNQSSLAEDARQAAGVPDNANFFSAVGATDAGIEYELDFAKALIEGEKLGTGNVTDVLTISISSTDILGHRVGPDSPEQRQLIDQLNGNLNDFFGWLDDTIPGGLKNVWIALSADHGVAPVPENAQKLGIPAGTLQMKPFVAALNKAMNDRFSPQQHYDYVMPTQYLPYISLNTPVFEREGLNELEGERAIQAAIPAALAEQLPEWAKQPDSKIKPSTTRLAPGPQIFRTYTRLQMASLQPGVPPTAFGRLIAHSYSPNGGWYVMVILDPYQKQGKLIGATHFSPWSYDRHVPLAFYGSAFKPGTYAARVQPVDLAATLADALRVNQPSSSIGAVLTQALEPQPSAKPEARHTRTRRSQKRGSSAQRKKAPAPEKSKASPRKPANSHP
jgi:predicted AlkP superfamily pyrophosphatase or phosphodiesterase